MSDDYMVIHLKCFYIKNHYLVLRPKGRTINLLHYFSNGYFCFYFIKLVISGIKTLLTASPSNLLEEIGDYNNYITHLSKWSISNALFYRFFRKSKAPMNRLPITDIRPASAFIKSEYIFSLYEYDVFFFRRR